MTRVIRTTKKIRVSERKKNQYGDPLTRAVEIRTKAYQCSNCASIMLPDKNGQPPARCSNRKGKGKCGKVFYRQLPSAGDQATNPPVPETDRLVVPEAEL